MPKLRVIIINQYEMLAKSDSLISCHCVDQRSLKNTIQKLFLYWILNTASTRLFFLLLFMILAKPCIATCLQKIWNMQIIAFLFNDQFTHGKVIYNIYTCFSNICICHIIGVYVRIYIRICLYARKLISIFLVLI